MNSEKEQLRFDGKVAVISGAGGGLGREYALYLASRGARVVVNDIKNAEPRTVDPGALQSSAAIVAQEIIRAGGEALANTSSVATLAGGRSIIDAAVESWGRVDIVINNAGTNSGLKGREWDEDRFGFARLEDDEINDMMAVNLFASFNLLRPAWAIMQRQEYGRILNTSSGNLFGNIGSVSYSVAKAGVIGMTTNLAIEGERWGIKINTLMPTAWTVAAEYQPAVRQRLLTEHFPASKVSPIVAFLVHENVPCSGECFAAAGGRFARVFIGETVGRAPEPLSPETVQSSFSHAMATEGFATPHSSAEHVKFTCEMLGIPYTA